MHRRNFLKTVTGFIAGLFTLPSLAKEKPKLAVSMLQKAKAEPTVYSLWAEGKSVPAEVFEREGLHTGGKYDPTKIWAEAEAKTWAKRSDEIILNCMNA